MNANSQPDEGPELTVCPNPLFVIGSPRSGTTILAWSLAQHQQFWVSGELHILYRLYGSQPLAQIFEREQTLPGLIQKEKVSHKELLGALGLGLNALLTNRSQGKRWIDHTPVNTLMVDLLAGMFPGAQFLHILRDGRKVVNSMVNFDRSLVEDERASRIKTGFYPPWATDFREACKTWRESVEKATAFLATHPGRGMTLLHQELVSKPQECFSEIMEFLNVPREDAPANYFGSSRINTSFPDSGTPPEQAEDGETTGPWESWSPDQRTIFLEEAADTLIRCGLAKQEDVAR